MTERVQFNEEHSRLNERQREAVDTIEGPVMVVAGPGTGKTQILTLRIANILRLTDTPPSAILALTFTNAGVYAMRERLKSIIGAAAYKVRIHTFHSFCNETIARYPEYFPRIIGGANVAEPERHTIVEHLIDTGGYTRIRPVGDPHYYVKGAIRAISDLKREYIDPDRFDVLLNEHHEELESDPDAYHAKGRWAGQMKGAHKEKLRALEKNRELAQLYRAYEEELARRHFFDFDDMIGEVVRAMEANEDLRLILQEEHQYLLADEHQDANDAQNRILDLLASFFESPNLFVVGDTKQAIYRFQGASKENFTRFAARYPDARVITLEDNYRSHQIILDAAFALLAEDKLTARADHEPLTITRSVHQTLDAEHAFLASHIAARLAEGVPPSEIAVIYRTNSEAEALARTLAVHGIAAQVESKQDILTDPIVRLLVALLRTVSELGNNEALAEALWAPFLPLEPHEPYELLTVAKEERRSLSATVKERAPALWHTLARLSEEARVRTALDAVALVIDEVGFMPWALSRPDARALVDAVRGLSRVLRDLAVASPRLTLREALAYLDATAAYGLLELSASGEGSDRVHLMTAHRAKGREFDYVYLPHVVERRWSNSANRRDFKLPIYGPDVGATEDDERRLFFVAVTRARKDLVVSYAQLRDDGSPEVPAELLEDMVEHCIEKQEPIRQEEFKLQPAPPVGPALTDRTYVREIFMRRGLSATALNNYLTCPWRYFFTNLIRIPEAKAPHMHYGTAVHGALEDFFIERKNASDPGVEWLIGAFAARLARQPLAQPDYDVFARKGAEALRGYYAAYAGSWHTEVVTEYKIAGVQLTDTIMLSGSLDKLEIEPDGRVVVVDYKTKTPESRNAIEGKTKNGSGDMKRQLVFYRLLLDNSADEQYRFVAGEIDFIEPTETGKYKKERFEIGDDEVHDLKETIVRVAGEIFDLAFWDMHCDEKDCRHCRLGEIVRMRGRS